MQVFFSLSSLLWSIGFSSTLQNRSLGQWTRKASLVFDKASVKVALFSFLISLTWRVVRAVVVRKQERLIRSGPSGKPYTPAPQALARDSYVEARVSFSIAVSGAATSSSDLCSALTPRMSSAIATPIVRTAARPNPNRRSDLSSVWLRGRAYAPAVEADLRGIGDAR